MDPITHALFGYVLFGSPVNIILLFIFTNLSDITSIPFRIYEVIRKNKFSFSYLFLDDPPSKRYLTLYRTTHSLLFIFLVFFILSFSIGNYLILSLYSFSHIILDFFSHSDEWATRLFYPFSDFHVNFFNYHRGRKGLLMFFIVFILILSLSLFKILWG